MKDYKLDTLIKIITIEESFFGEIIFYIEDNIEHLKKIIKLQSDIIDDYDVLEGVLNNWERNDFFFTF